jgi:hypothetical protein
MAEMLEYVVQIKGGKESAAEVKALTDQTRALGATMKKIGQDDAKTMMSGTDRVTHSLKKLALSLGAVGSAYYLYDRAKQAIENTHQLAEATSTLTSTTGMSVEESSRWVTIAKAVGSSGQTVTTAFQKLAAAAEEQTKANHGMLVGEKKRASQLAELEQRQRREMFIAKERASHEKNRQSAAFAVGSLAMRQEEELNKARKAATEHTENAATAFDKLHISAKFVEEHQKNLGPLMWTVVERLDMLNNKAEKDAMLSKLLGRGWQDAAPLLLEGREHLEELMKAAKEYGAELSGDPMKAVEELAMKKRELSLAEQGLEIAFTKLAAGPLKELMHDFTDLAKAMKSGDWKKVEQDANHFTEQLVHITEKAVPKIAGIVGKAAPKIIEALIKGFASASIAGQAAIALFIAKKLGLTEGMWKGIGKKVGGAFGTGVEAEGTAAGTGFGNLFGKAFLLALVGLDIYHTLLKGSPTEPEPLGELFDPITGDKNKREKAEARQESKEHNEYLARLHHRQEAHERHLKARFRRAEHEGPLGKARLQGQIEAEQIVREAQFPHGALGGTVTRGGAMLVGERGPEMVSLPSGAMVNPLAPGSMNNDRPIKLYVDGREMLRVLRRGSLEEQAAGSGVG